MISMELLAKDIVDLKKKLQGRENFNYHLSLLLREALDGFFQGVVTRNELQLVLCISSLPCELDTELKQFSATLEKKCPNT